MSDQRQLITWLLKDKYHQSTEKLDFDQLAPELLHDLKRLQQGEPLAYVIGWVDFLGCRIDLSKKTLIPRPETEYWVEQAIRKVLNFPNYAPQKSLRVLDLCCGSGCIGIAILKHLPNVTTDFVDTDPNAVTQTEQNLQLNHCDQNRTHVFCAHLFESCSGEYDFIFSNPPYVSDSGEVGDETKY